MGKVNPLDNTHITPEPTKPTVLEVGYSFCPNDTFIFHALHDRVISLPEPLTETGVLEVLEDVQTLNDWAKERRLPVTKISYRAYFEVMPQYVALRSGGALGRGVGPLLVCTQSAQHMVQHVGARGASASEPVYVASPGALTTAELLLRLCWNWNGRSGWNGNGTQERAWHPVHMRYDEVMPAVLRGEYQGQPIHAGLIIHESRFTYARQGLVLAVDLGKWWEEETNLPLPLGAILVRRDMPRTWQQALQRGIRQSLMQAWEHPERAREYIRQHALEMSDEVMQAHIDLYVNKLSYDVGDEGERAVCELHRRAVLAGVVPASSESLFVPADPADPTDPAD